MSRSMIERLGTEFPSRSFTVPESVSSLPLEVLSSLLVDGSSSLNVGVLSVGVYVPGEVGAGLFGVDGAGVLGGLGAGVPGDSGSDAALTVSVKARVSCPAVFEAVKVKV